MTLFAERTAIEFIVGHFLLPMLGVFVVAFIFGGIGKAARKFVVPHVEHWWMNSTLRVLYHALSRGQLLFLVGLGGNLAVVVFCLPLLRIPAGSAIKPMALPFLFVVIASVTLVAIRTLWNDSRPPGFFLLRTAAVILCLMPLVTGGVLMNLFASLRGLEFG